MNCLIIDDNPKTARILQALLVSNASITKVHTTVTTHLVGTLLEAERIDIIFLRVRLWDFRCFENLDQVPVFVFLSGGKDKLTAKEGTCVSYSLREPYDAIELSLLLQKIKQAPVIEQPNFLFLRYQGRFHKTLFTDIELIERKGDYAQFFLRTGECLVPGSMPGWINRLPNDMFVRISDRLIVPAAAMQHISQDGRHYDFKGRSIRLTFRFAVAARKEMIDTWPDEA